MGITKVIAALPANHPGRIYIRIIYSPPITQEKVAKTAKYLLANLSAKTALTIRELSSLLASSSLLIKWERIALLEDRSGAITLLIDRTVIGLTMLSYGMMDAFFLITCSPSDRAKSSSNASKRTLSKLQLDRYRERIVWSKHSGFVSIVTRIQPIPFFFARA